MSEVPRGDEGSEDQQAQLAVLVLRGPKVFEVKPALMASQDPQVQQ